MAVSRSASSLREDFALESVPPANRRQRALVLFNVTFGIPTALVFFATGAELRRIYGVAPLIEGSVVVAVIVSVAGLVLTAFASRTGLDSDLASIVAGFGLRGSAVTSLIYSANFIILFGLEDDIIATSIHAQFPYVARWAVLSIGAGALVGLAWYGIASLAITMAATLPIFLILIGAFVAKVSAAAPVNPSDAPKATATAALVIAGSLMAFVVNATVAADVGRFLGVRYRRVGITLLGIGPQVASFLGAVMLGAWVEGRLGISDPGIAFVRVMGLWGLVIVAASQLRINLINLYAGSLSLSNFGRRALNISPGRHVWVMLLAVAGTVLAMFNIYEHLLSVLTFESVFTCGWVAVLVTIVLRRKYLRDPIVGEPPLVDPVGLVSLVLGVGCSSPFAFGVSGHLGQACAPFIAATVASLSVLVLENAKRGRG